MKPKFVFLGIFVGITLLVTFFTTLPDGKLHITFCDVGQGDATYMRLPDGRNVLIDGGPDQKVLTCLGKYMPFWDRTIDVVILTHPEKDHFGGLGEVIQRYTVPIFLGSGIENSSQEFQTFLESMATHGVQKKELHAGDRIPIGNALFSFFSPTPELIAKQTLAEEGDGGTKSFNDQSLVFTLRYGEFLSFFPGDAGVDAEEDFVGTPLGKTSVDILKVPHHGSATGMNDAFVSWLSPKLAIISVGAKNSYHHPSDVALNLLSSIHTNIVRTDQKGSVTITTNGKTWSVQTERK